MWLHLDLVYLVRREREKDFKRSLKLQQEAMLSTASIPIASRLGNYVSKKPK
jgi:hypothetical protein